ncbi:bacteriocin [Halosimplex pelagicum]|uniref:Bacteriocin n=1 Tax=Halosimplex pelagicum TaxID=869886 RepID=A0A7D5SVR4_9EURY|nr:bacteriocin [Halosimplex pelagicum]QLH82467.1 bacteriocin [Halosimplex pelagicum]QLH82523.1 bacteriocin [Halosimplex pelagicum]
MSADISTETKWSKSVENDLSLTAQKALFNPVPKVRKQALQQLRAESPFSPDQWDQLDKATGVKSSNPTAELTADSTLEVDSWAQYADMVLNDQFVQSTVVDQLIGAGFVASSDLSRYAYFTPMSGTRLEGTTSMNLRTRSEQEMPGHALDGVPLPMDIVTYQIDAREFQNAQAFGEDFDDSIGTEARQALNRLEHNKLWGGWGPDVQTERGLLKVRGLNSNIPEIIQASNSTGWIGDAAGMLEDIDTLHDSIEDQTDVVDQDDVPLVSEVGAWLMVPRAMWGEFTRQDYETEQADQTVRDRVEQKYDYLNIVPAPRLDADSVIMMLDDPRYFEIVNAQGVTNTSWESDGGAALNNRLISSRTPFIKTQPDGISGITRMTGINA